MNSSSAEVAAGSAAPITARRPGETLLTLVRREFWEHRALWLAPLIVTLLLAACAIIGTVQLDMKDAGHLADRQQRVALFTILQWVVAALLFVVVTIVLSFYLLDCLYAERKDRSILFWKSMPVSDGMTVLSKVAVAFVVVPLGVFVLAILGGLMFCAIIAVRIALGGVPSILSWDTLEWLRSELAMLLILVLGLMWYAPVGACLLLLSAWARRVPFLWALLPPILAVLLELIAFRTLYVWHFIVYRSLGIWATLGLDQAHVFSRHGLRPVGTLLEDLNFGAAFTDGGLWLGLAVAAALVFAATRIRRYRDDT